MAVLCLLAGHGETMEVSGQQLWRLSISVENAAHKAGCAKATWLAGVRDLVDRGVLAVVDLTRPRTYVANWSRLVILLDRLAPAPTDEAAFAGQIEGLLAENWSGPVRPGQGARDSVNRLDRVRVGDSVNRGRDSAGGADRADRPWQTTTDEELRRAVIDRELGILRTLYNEALALGWIDDGPDARLRFLTIAHHCATAVGLHRRMGGLVARVKRNLDVTRTRHRSEEWARGVLRRRPRLPDDAAQLAAPIGAPDT